MYQSVVPKGQEQSFTVWTERDTWWFSKGLDSLFYLYYFYLQIYNLSLSLK